MADDPPRRKSRFDSNPNEEPRRRSRFEEPVSAAPRKSRFEELESAAPRKSRFESRFDRNRSRSPPAPDRNRLDNYRGRSPLRGEATASERAARISAAVAERTAAGREYVPSYRSSGAAIDVTSEIYVQDGEYMKDIEINDLKTRFFLMKEETLKNVKENTGTDVIVRGEYYPDKKMAKASAPPLHLHLTNTSKDGLEKAIATFEEHMKMDMPDLVDRRRWRRNREPEDVERDHLGRRKWPEERLPIDLEPIPGFNLRAQVVGQGGENVKYIQENTRAKVQIKGFGSGFKEIETGMESNEPMYLHITSPIAEQVARAKEQCEELLQAVKQRYNEFKENNQNRPAGGFGSHTNQNGHGRRGRNNRRGDEDPQPNGGDVSGTNPYAAYNYQGYGAQQPGPAGGAPDGTAQAYPQAPDINDPAAIEAYEAYYTQWYGYNPFAAYGGYVGYIQAFQQYQQPGDQQVATTYPEGTASYAGATAGYTAAAYPGGSASYAGYSATSYPNSTASYAGATAGYPAASYPYGTGSYAGATAYTTADGSYPGTASYYTGAAAPDAGAAPPPPPTDDAPPPPPPEDGAPPPPPPGA